MTLKRLLSACALYLLCKLAPLSAQLEIHHLVGNAYVYTNYRPLEGEPYPSNSMYVVTPEGVVLIDTPWDTTQLQPLLDSLEARHHKKAVLCIATHFHDDSSAGLTYYASKGILTYSSEQTKRLAAERGEPEATYTFSRDTVFTVGGYSFMTYYPGPGHSPDNIVVWCPEDLILYGGCFVKSTESEGLGYLGDADVSAWKMSIIKTISAFAPPMYVIPGHFGWADNRSLKHTLKLLYAHGKKD